MNKKKEVSVDKAIKIGHLLISYPMIVLSVLTFLTILYFAYQIEPEKESLIYGTITFILIVTMMIFVPLLYRSFVVVKWKKWAFGNVRNVHELKERAILENILFDESNPLSKFEIKKWDDKKELEKLKSKFEKDDIFIDDLRIADEKKIYYHKTNIVALLVISFFIILGIIIIIETKTISASLMIMIGLYLGYIHFKDTVHFNKKPQIILNEKGIKTINTPFYEWNEIENIKLIEEKNNFFLIFHHPKGIEKLNLANFDTNAIKLDKLIRIYKGRSKNNR